MLIAGLLAVAGLLLLLTVWPPTPRPVVVERPGETARTGKKPDPQVEEGRSFETPERIKKAGVQAGEEMAEEPARAERTVTGSGTIAAPEVKTVREKAVESWEALLDRVIEQKEVPAAKQAKGIKETFDKLAKEDQMEGIHQALNLLPDEQFPTLYAILFDKSERPEVLDAIFSDALNRPEELKNPLMKELVKDKEHPCFFESARILDVIGELEVRSSPTPSP